MEIVVTDAADVLGSEITKRLRHERCYDVRATDILDGDGIERANLCQQNQVQEIVDGAEVVIHCAAARSWKQHIPDQYLDSNVKACHHVFAAFILAIFPAS
jgi:nucleoside-diphosphate-sugar epimerase